MKNLVSSLLIIVGVFSTAAGASHAYLSDTENSIGNTISAGTLEINDDSAGWMQTITFSNMKPGNTIRKWYVIKNTGTLSIGSLRVSSANVNDTTGLLGQIKISLIGQVTGYPNAYYSHDWTGGDTITPFLNSSGVNVLGTYVYSGGTPATTIPVGDSDTIIMDFTLPAGTATSWQGKQASFDVRFLAEQIH